MKLEVVVFGIERLAILSSVNQDLLRARRWVLVLDHGKQLYRKVGEDQDLQTERDQAASKSLVRLISLISKVY